MLAVVDLFSYAVLSREDEVAAKEDAAIIKAHMKSAAESIIAVGLALKRQKERLPHGMFLPWIEAEFGMSYRTANRIINRAEKWAKVANLASFGAQASAQLLDEISDDDTPQSVRDQVEALIVDGQKITAADVKRLKAEAKAAQAGADALASRNAELAEKVSAPAAPVDADRIRAEAIAEAEKRLSARIDELSQANVAAAAEIRRLTKAAAGPRAGESAGESVVRPDFGGPVDPSLDGEILSETDAIDAFSGALGSMKGLQFSPKDFWKAKGKSGSHSKLIHKTLLEVNATIGLLIQEYSK